MSNDTCEVWPMTEAQIAALIRAAERVIEEWEAYSGEGPAGWTETEVDALGQGVKTLRDASPIEGCPICGGKIRRDENGKQYCRDEGHTFD